MELKNIRYFVEVVEQKSINKAATKLYVTQPSLTRAIQSLEAELGAQLLIRTNHGVEVTLAGENAYYYAKSVQNQIEALGKIRALNDTLVQTRLGVSVARIILNDDLMLHYRQKVSSDNMGIQIMETGVESALEDVSAVRTDIGLIMVNSLQLPVLKKVAEIKGLDVHIISKSDLYIYMNRNSALVQKETLLAKELKTYTRISLPEDYFSNMNYSLRGGDTQLIDIKHNITMNNYHSIICMLRHSESFIFGGIWQKEEMEKGGMRCSRVEDFDGEMYLLWVKRKREILPDNVKVFIELLLDNYT